MPHHSPTRPVSHTGDQSPLILVVEDEPKIAAAVSDYLRANGMRVLVLQDGDQVLTLLGQQSVDAMILDIMLPGLDGFSLTRRLRDREAQLPILITSARVEELDRLLGFELGVDDYLCKPYSLRELLARLKALLRRSQTNGQNVGVVRDLGFEFDGASFTVRFGGKSTLLTRVECRLLEKLAERPGQICSREALLLALYDDHRVVSDRTVDSHVRNLRKKLAELELDVIDSVYGAGFRLVPPR